MGKNLGTSTNNKDEGKGLMKSYILFLNFIFSQVAFSAHYPKVSEIQGKVFDHKQDGKLVKVAKSDIFKKQALLSTEMNSLVKIELDSNTTLLLAENSTLEFPAIAYEEGEVSVANLLSGKLWIQSRGNSERRYTTPISSDVYSNVDFLIEYSTENLKAQVFVFSKGLQFRGTESEDVVRVGAHEKVSFIGIPEKGKPSFDILLGGKKVAKGKLGIVEPLTEPELRQIEKELSFIQKRAAVKKVKQLPRLKNQICEKPFAKINECSWHCFKWDKKRKVCLSDCIRKRCNANGEWSDNFIDKNMKSKCVVVPLAAPCDY